MRKLQELVKEVKTAIEKVSGEVFAMSTNGGPNTYERDASLVAAKVRSLRSGNALLHKELCERTQERDRARASADRLRQTRMEVRSVLGADPHERTADAARRVVEKPYGFSELEIRTILGAKLSESTADAAKRAMKPGGKMALAVTNLRKARAEVREILGARPGEGSRAAAMRVMRQLEQQTNYPKTSCDPGTVFHVYNELDALAQKAGYPAGSVGSFVRRLQQGKKTFNA